MALGIKALLSGREPDPEPLDTTKVRALMGDLRSLEPATVDSIFQVLGVPAKPIRVDDLGGPAGTFVFRSDRPDYQQISMDYRLPSYHAARTLAHERVHEEAFKPDTGVVAQQFRNFMTRLDTLPNPQRTAILDAYYGGGAIESAATAMANVRRGADPENTEENLNVLFDRLQEIGKPGVEVQEGFAKQMELGYDLARRMHGDPVGVTAELQEAEERLPGTLDMFTFWMKGFSDISRPDGT